MKEETAQKILAKVKLDYDQIAEDFSQTRAAPWPEFEIFKEYLTPGMIVADIGCGNGRLRKSLPEGISYTGIDISEKLLNHAKKIWPSEKFFVGSLLDIPLPDSSSDATFCIAALHHIPSKKLRQKAVYELSRITKSDGYIFVSVWNLWQKKYISNILKAIGEKLTLGDLDWNDLLIKWQNQVDRYYHAFTKKELKTLLEEKFKILQLLTSSNNYIAVCKKK